MGAKENLVPTGIRFRTVQPVVSSYTDRATGPTICITVTMFKTVCGSFYCILRILIMTVTILNYSTYTCISCAIRVYHVPYVYIMCHTCISCAIRVYHVQYVYIMCHTCISCAIRLYHVPYVYIMCHTCISCAIRVYHVLYVYIMCHTCISCAIRVYHVPYIFLSTQLSF